VLVVPSWYRTWDCHSGVIWVERRRQSWYFSYATDEG